MNASSTQPFVSANRAARWSQRLLWATLIIAAVAATSDAFEFSLLSRTGAGVVSEAEATANDLRQGAIALLQLLIFIASAAAFLTWSYRVHKNLPALGARNLKYSPGWAVGGFFVPFLNCARPFQVMEEAWRRSYFLAHESDPTPQTHPQHPEPPTFALVQWWWGLLLLSAAFGRLGARIVAGDPTLEQLKAGSVVSVISDLLDIPAAWLAIRIIGYITRWQDERASRIQILPMAPPPPIPPPPKSLHVN